VVSLEVFSNLWLLDIIGEINWSYKYFPSPVLSALTLATIRHSVKRWVRFDF